MLSSAGEEFWSSGGALQIKADLDAKQWSVGQGELHDWPLLLSGDSDRMILSDPRNAASALRHHLGPLPRHTHTVQKIGFSGNFTFHNSSDWAPVTVKK